MIEATRHGEDGVHSRCWQLRITDIHNGDYMLQSHRSPYLMMRGLWRSACICCKGAGHETLESVITKMLSCATHPSFQFLGISTATLVKSYQLPRLLPDCWGYMQAGWILPCGGAHVCRDARHNEAANNVAIRRLENDQPYGH